MKNTILNKYLLIIWMCMLILHYNNNVFVAKDLQLPKKNLENNNLVKKNSDEQDMIRINRLRFMLISLIIATITVCIMVCYKYERDEEKMQNTKLDSDVFWIIMDKDV
jgi:ethanolamine utilization cobalamin adenosyltransferase